MFDRGSEAVKGHVSAVLAVKTKASGGTQPAIPGEAEISGQAKERHGFEKCRSWEKMAALALMSNVKFQMKGCRFRRRQRTSNLSCKIFEIALAKLGLLVAPSSPSWLTRPR